MMSDDKTRFKFSGEEKKVAESRLPPTIQRFYIAICIHILTPDVKSFSMNVKELRISADHLDLFGNF